MPIRGAQFPILFCALSFEILFSQDLRDSLVAHRGANNDVIGNSLDLYPENTILSMREAYRIGVRYVECDIQITNDDKVIILHDNTLLRTAKYDPLSYLSEEEFYQIVNADVETLAFNQISQINLGNETIDARIPLLDDFLEELSLDPERKLLIEIKRGGQRIIQAIAKCLNQYPLIQKDQILFISFDINLLSHSKKIFPANKHIFLLTSTPDEEDAYPDSGLKGQYVGLYHRIDSFEQLPHFIKLAKERGFNGISFEFTSAINKNWIQMVKNEGLLSYIWTYPKDDQLSTILKMFESGADLIATNQPEKILIEYGTQVINATTPLYQLSIRNRRRDSPSAF